MVHGDNIPSFYWYQQLASVVVLFLLGFVVARLVYRVPSLHLFVKDSSVAF